MLSRLFQKIYYGQCYGKKHIRNMEFLQGYKREVVERQYSRVAYM